ncbi:MULTISPECIES: hypothetical protein [Bradyrhizobium]|uniref:hypothetical protein n=1 Tax=Bradyrhizobium TaxID=374 RepID=UPI001BA496E8|nr:MULTISPECIES: hypothetical protein [Bradyrhizobium]MBR0708308.1 hypothetical protein [Bradyrhizobium liaoningense]MDA9401413.1 hypothetical protein [Bradyrhizobium sp. CCBAU 45389]
MERLVRYSVAAIVAFALAATGAYGIIRFFIRGFEALALLLPLTIVLFVPLFVMLVLLARGRGLP